MLVVDGYDRNYLSEDERAEWLQFYDALADRIIQPTLAPSRRPAGDDAAVLRVQSRAQVVARGFGPAQAVRHPLRRPQLVAVEGGRRGAAAGLRARSASQVGEIGFARPVVGSVCRNGRQAKGLEPAFQVDTKRIPPIAASARAAGALHRRDPHDEHGPRQHLLAASVSAPLKYLTLRYFEEFCADTIPLLMLEPDFAEAVYGPAGRELTLPGRVAEKVLDALQRPDHYRRDRRGRPPPLAHAPFLPPPRRGAGRSARRLKMGDAVEGSGNEAGLRLLRLREPGEPAGSPGLHPRRPGSWATRRPFTARPTQDRR